MSDQEQRVVSKCEHKFSASNCKKCGIHFHEGNMPVKTNYFNSHLNCTSSKYIKHLRKRKCGQLQTKQISQSTWTLLHAICEKFQYTGQTLALGIYIYAKTNAKYQKDEKFWASASLLVASKAIELDKKVPYLNRYQKYADKTFSQDDYQIAEKNICQEMGFNLQFSTFLSFLNFYMTIGVIFQMDCISQPNVKLIQDQIIFKAKQLLKNASFLSYDPQRLALSIIKQIRIKHRLQPWRCELQRISGFKQQQVHVIQRNNVLKPLCTLSVRAKQKLSLMSQHNTIGTIQSSFQMCDKPKLIRRKNESISKNNVKENTFKAQPQVHQVLLSNIRKQNLSVSKYSGSGIISNSSSASLQKRTPLTVFQSRRA